jgi:Short C-terminal domain
MNIHLSLHMKGFVSSRLISEMIIIIITIYFATFFSFSFFFFAPNIGAKAYAQVDNNSNDSSTLILDDMRAIMRDQQRDIASIRNTSSVEAGALTQMAASSSRLAIQATYTSLSVFFLGIGLVVFGLSLTTRSSPQIGKYFTMTVWALTLPVIVLIGSFQYGAITGNNLLGVFGSNPFLLLSFLMYIPIAIVVFLLLAQKKIMHVHEVQAAHAAKVTQEAHAAQVRAQAAAQESSQVKKDPYQDLERLGSLKQQGLITDEEFEKLKTQLLSSI